MIQKHKSIAQTQSKNSFKKKEKRKRWVCEFTFDSFSGRVRLMFGMGFSMWCQRSGQLFHRCSRHVLMCETTYEHVVKAPWSPPTHSPCTTILSIMFNSAPQRNVYLCIGLHSQTNFHVKQIKWNWSILGLCFVASSCKSFGWLEHHCHNSRACTAWRWCQTWVSLQIRRVSI